MTDRKEDKTLKEDRSGIPQSRAEEDYTFPNENRLDDDQLQCAAFLAKSLSDANRLKILLIVSGGRKSVSAIVEELDLSQPLVSHHLKELRRSLLVRVEREGPFIYYELADQRILNILKDLSYIATDLLSARKTF